MDWKSLLSAQREYREYQKSDIRNAFQRDYDRIIFSNIFRRLQNKTQVFPLPGSKMVHNRLTHSLEVASVGRSIAKIVAKGLCDKYGNDLLNEIYDIDTIVSAACLAHDLGNPPFGHSGEETISSYFKEGPGKELEKLIPDYQWSDLTSFEGNANAFRLLTHQFNGRRNGGYVLTYSTLASIIKYPYPSTEAKSKAKFGYFKSETESYNKIANELGIKADPDDPKRHMRHPLVFLVEAADDICYQIMDIEDAYKLRILSLKQTTDLLMRFIPTAKHDYTQKVCQLVSDPNEQVAYLRSATIGNLIEACSNTFLKHEEEILSGKLHIPLIKLIPEYLKEAYEECVNTAVASIYCAPMVLDIELAGYKIISTLLEELTLAITSPNSNYSKQLLKRIPSQYEITSPDMYGRVQAILDYISGMTDIYALDLYRKITGMSLPSL